MADSDFPAKNFVLEAMAEYFADAGFEFVRSSRADLECVAADSDVRWVVEAAGGAKAEASTLYGKVGRLLTYMGATRQTNFVLAIPALRDFERLCEGISDDVRGRLNLWWYVVGQEGAVLAIAPADRLSAYRFNAR